MFITLEPQGKKIACHPELSLLESLQKKDFDIIASICGGEGTCGKCRIRILSGAVSEPTEQERQALAESEIRDNIRLACQTFPKESLSVNIIESSSAAQYKTSLGMELSGIAIAPDVKKTYLELPPPSLTDQRADVERIFRELSKKDIAASDIAPRLLPCLPQLLRQSDWAITATLLDERVIGIETGNTANANYGIAFDLGTTTVAAYLADLNNGELLGQAALTNRQSSFGEDVMTRIDRAHGGDLGKLQNAAIRSMNILLDRLIDETGVQPENIYEAVIVGNTCMHHLLLGIDPYTAGIAPFTPAVNISPDISAAFLGLEIAPEAMVHLPPVISGFVGADTVGDILALDFDKKQPPHLMIDIGTNAEMALTMDGKILACSAAAGPAFEGARISCGMRAAPGAIDRVAIKDGTIQSHTIDNKPAAGIAGSGLISVAAGLKREGLMNRRGALKQKSIPEAMRDSENRGVVLAPADRTRSGEPLVLTWRDIGEELVIAKAAIRTGIEILLKEAELELRNLERISIAGAFGNFLNIADAMEIGLLPNIAGDKIAGVGNAAGKGAVQILLSTDERQRAHVSPGNIRYIELSGYPGFNRLFSANMKL